MSQNLPRRFGDYLLLHLVGRGGNGAAYLASPLGIAGLPNPLIVKTMTPAAAERENDRARFQHEARLAVAANVPSVATVYDAGLVGDTPYIAMELVRGMTVGALLKKLSEQRVFLSTSQVLDIALSGLLGLRALQEAVDDEGRALQVVHRDVSPRNLMLDRRGQVRILDLGLGRSLLSELHTRTGSILGTPGYMSPEQVLGTKTTQASDVYAFAVIVWELLTMQRYILRGPLPEVLKRTVQRVYEPPSSHRPGLPPELDHVLASALSLDAKRRLPDAAHFRDALLEVREQSPLAAGDRERALVELQEFHAPELNEQQIAELLAPPEAEPPPDRAKTIVYARRAPETITEAPFGAPASTTAGRLELRTETAPAAAAPTTVEPRPAVALPENAGARGRGPLLAGVLVALFGAGVLTVLGAWPRERPTQDPVLVPRVPETRPQVRAVAAPGSEAESEAEATLEPPTRGVVESPDRSADGRPTTRRVARTVAPARERPAESPTEAAPTVDESPPPVELDARTQLERLMLRGEALKRATPDRAAEIDEITNAAVFESVAGDTPTARRRLRELARRLERIAEAGQGVR